MTDTNNQPPSERKSEAVRLADALLMGEAMIPDIDLPEAAAELRRLDAIEQAALQSRAQVGQVPRPTPEEIEANIWPKLRLNGHPSLTLWDCVSSIYAAYPTPVQEQAQAAKVSAKSALLAEHREYIDAHAAGMADGRHLAAQPAEVTDERLLEIGREWAKEVGWYEFEVNDFIGCARAILALRPVQSGLTGCNCRWDGDTQVQWRELHLAHKEAMHEWAERAKEAEKQLALRHAAVPMSDEQIVAGITESEANAPISFMKGVRFAEARYGITAQTKEGGIQRDV